MRLIHIQFDINDEPRKTPKKHWLEEKQNVKSMKEMIKFGCFLKSN